MADNPLCQSLKTKWSLICTLSVQVENTRQDKKKEEKYVFRPQKQYEDNTALTIGKY